MTTPLRSDPIAEPSTLLRASPPLCPASVLRPLRRLTAWVSPFASGRQVPVFLTEACLEVTPPSCRTPVGQSAGSPQPLLAGYVSLPWQFKGTFRGISVGYEFRIGKAKRRRYLWKRKNCQSSVKGSGMGVDIHLHWRIFKAFPLVDAHCLDDRLY